ncbi:unnamed protein product, partial [Amoebophrya sp. A25]
DTLPGAVDARAASCAGHLKSVLLGMPVSEYSSRKARDALQGYPRHLIENIQDSFAKRGWVTLYKRRKIHVTGGVNVIKRDPPGTTAAAPCNNEEGDVTPAGG